MPSNRRLKCRFQRRNICHLHFVGIVKSLPKQSQLLSSISSRQRQRSFENFLVSGVITKLNIFRDCSLTFSLSSSQSSLSYLSLYISFSRLEVSSVFISLCLFLYLSPYLSPSLYLSLSLHFSSSHFPSLSLSSGSLNRWTDINFETKKSKIGSSMVCSFATLHVVTGSNPDSISFKRNDIKVMGDQMVRLFVQYLAIYCN